MFRAMPPLPYEAGFSRVLFDILVFIFVAMELGIRVQSGRNRGSGSRELGSLVVVALTIGVGIVGAVLISVNVPATNITVGTWAVFIVGLVCLGAGIAIRLWAVIALGRYFTVDVRVRPDQKVVDRGPYRWVRHPSYTGLLLAVLGIGLALDNWLSLIVALVLPLVGILYRIRIEERALLAGIGEPYRVFCATRARLIPHVW